MSSLLLLKWTECLAYPYYSTVSDIEMFRSGWLYNIILMRISEKMLEDEMLALRKQSALVNIDKASIITRVLKLPMPFKPEDISRVEADKLEAFLQELFEYFKTVRCLTSDESALTEAELIKSKNEDIVRSLEEQAKKYKPKRSRCNIL